MDGWTIADTISGFVGTFFGILGTIISFVTMKKTTSIENSIKVQKNTRAFNVQYETLKSQLNLVIEQLQKSDFNSALISISFETVNKIKQLAHDGGWERKDVDVIDSVYDDLSNRFSVYKLGEYTNDLEKNLISVRNILDKVANLHDIR